MKLYSKFSEFVGKDVYIKFKGVEYAERYRITKASVSAGSLHAIDENKKDCIIDIDSIRVVSW